MSVQGQKCDLPSDDATEALQWLVDQGIMDSRRNEKTGEMMYRMKPGGREELAALMKSLDEMGVRQ